VIGPDSYLPRTSNLRVGGSNPSERANEIKYLAARRRRKSSQNFELGGHWGFERQAGSSPTRDRRLNACGFLTLIRPLACRPPRLLAKLQLQTRTACRESASLSREFGGDRGEKSVPRGSTERQLDRQSEEISKETGLSVKTIKAVCHARKQIRERKAQKRKASATIMRHIETFEEIARETELKLTTVIAVLAAQDRTRGREAKERAAKKEAKAAPPSMHG
jgi:hypothetical protein